MIEHYNAFISYKHAPLDNKVAAEIQTRLERFRIPKAIRKASGIKKIDRIFRDKEELLITSDLNETIENALVHSDFLIVICSHATKESIWVQREIEFFLKTHPRNQVLTVVVEGEPVDVVPQILQEQEVTVTLDSGETETVIMPMEPLSCDYRGDFRKARKEELPRLVAAILGCSYDELKQRQRQYRMRRMALAFSAVAVLLAALSVYYAWSASQIRENYIASLKNQSKYLSSESLTLLEQGDRFNAMLLALEALPKDEEDDRPVIPQAEYALSKAANAYVSPRNNWFSVEYSFSHGGKIDRIFTTKDEAYLIVCHSEYAFTIWNVETREKVCEQIMDNYISYAAMSFDDKLMIVSDFVVYCYDCGSGQLLWQQDIGSYKGNSGSSSALVMSEAAPILACAAGDYLVIMDTATGQVLQEHPMPTYEKESDWSDETVKQYGLEFGKFSEDNKKLFLHLSGDEDYLALCDLEVQTFRIFDYSFFSVDDAFFTEEGNVLMIGKYRLRNGNYWIAPLYYYDDDYTEVACFTPEGELLWADEIHYTEMDVGLGSEVLPFDYPADDGTTVAAVACAAGEKLVFYDIATGDMLEENAYTAAIVTLSKYDGYFSAVLVDGMVGQYSFSDKLNMAGDFCIEGIDLACDNNHLYVSNSDTGSVLLYTYGLHDENWIQMDTEGEITGSFFSFTKYSAGGVTLLVRINGLKEPFVVINEESCTTRIYEPLSEEFLDKKFIQGLSLDGKAILFQDFNQPDNYVGALDLETLEYIPNYYELPSYWDELSFQDDVLYFKGMIKDQDGESSWGLIRQFSDGKYEATIVPTVDPEASLSAKKIVVTHKGEDMALMVDWNYDEPQYYYTVNLVTGQICNTAPFHYTETMAVWSEDGETFFATDENCIVAYDRACQERYRIPCNGMSVTSLFCTEDALLVLYGTDKVYRYQVSDGAFLNKIEVDAGSSVIGGCRWDASQPGTLALYNDDTLNLIDTQYWVVRAQVDHCLSFSLADGLIFTAQNHDNEGMRFGYYEMYDYQELIALARQQLGESVLPEELRIKYGLG